MKIARFTTPGGATAHGVVDGDTVELIEGDILGQWRRTTESVPLSDVKLLAPVDPPNILCIGKNYKAHAEEGGSDVPAQPVLFIKATTCLNNPEGEIVLPKAAPDNVDYEAELAVVIGKKARHVTRDEALDYVLGYTCAHDVSARDCQRNDGQWARAKSFDTFGPLGPWIETELDPGDLQVTGRLNGRVMQQSSTAMLIFDVPYLISYLSRCIALLPGTVLLTGTPEGVGMARKPAVFLRPGDVYEVQVEGIGILRNPVVMER